MIKFLIIFFLFLQTAQAQEGCSKVYSYLIFNSKNGDVISEEKSTKISYPASLVKLMTLYLTFEALENNKIKQEQVLTVSAKVEEIARVNKINSLKLKEGDKITVKEAIRGTIVKSFNETAEILAEAVAGDEWHFVRKMNDKAKKLGMNDTSFRNPSGLHEEGQYTTTYDLARLVLALQKDFPEYYHLFSLKEFKYRDTKYETHNNVLLDYKGAEGMKTGFTNASGFNLISIAKKNNYKVVSILLGCSTSKARDQFTKSLLDNAFLEKPTNPEVKITKNFDYKKQEIGRNEYDWR